MSRGGAVVVFPGQGTLGRSPFRTGALRAQFCEVAEEIGMTGETAERLLDQPLTTPDRLSLFVLAASLAHYRVLQSQRLRPVALVGHGFGEIIALVCAGAFSPERGAEIVRLRTAALEAHCRHAGGMVVARTSRSTADDLVQAVGPGRVSVAAENSHSETVLSGTSPGLDDVVRLARQRGIAVERLIARWPLHCGSTMLRAAAEFANQLRLVPSQPTHTPVFSSVLSRYYRDSDHLGECLALHFALPVRFADAIGDLWREGFRTFIACGALNGLQRSIDELTRRGLPDDLPRTYLKASTRDDAAATLASPACHTSATRVRDRLERQEVEPTLVSCGN